MLLVIEKRLKQFCNCSKSKKVQVLLFLADSKVHVFSVKNRETLFFFPSSGCHSDLKNNGASKSANERIIDPACLNFKNYSALRTASASSRFTKPFADCFVTCSNSRNPCIGPGHSSDDVTRPQNVPSDEQQDAVSRGS